MKNKNIEEVIAMFPFVTHGRMLGEDYVGIILNCDNQLLSMYVITGIEDKADREEFLRLGESWWWESNRQIPIHIFHKGAMAKFRPCIKHFSRRDFEILGGHPGVSLQETIARRVRKRQVTLVRRPD